MRLRAKDTYQSQYALPYTHPEKVHHYAYIFY